MISAKNKIFIIFTSLLFIISASSGVLARAKKITSPKKSSIAKKASPKKAAVKNVDIKAVQAKIERAKAEQEQNKMEQEKLRAQASQIDGELQDTKIQMKLTAQKIRDNETSLFKFDKMIADLQNQEKDIQNKLKYNSQSTAFVMMAFQNLALYQQGTKFLQDKSPLEMVRTSILLTSILPYLEKNANAFKVSFDNLIKVRDGISKMRADTKSVNNAMNEEKKNMQKLMNSKAMEKEKIKRRDNVLTAENKKLVAQAKNFEDLLTQLLAQAAREKARKAQAAAVSQGKKYIPRAPSLAQDKNSAFYKAHGQMIMPAIGEIVEFFGKTNKLGVRSKGIRVKTRATAQVVSSYDGSIIFADYFKGYGNMIILDNGDGYNTLIAGLDRLDVGAGQEVLAGEPLGQMGSQDDGMYMEIRSNGQAIDPMFFLKR